MAVAFRAAETETVGTSSAAVYTCPTTKTAVIQHAVVNNLDASNDTTITITVTPSGGSAAEYVSARTIPAGKSYQLPEITGLVLDSGDAVSAQASAAGDLNIKLSIKEIT